MGRKLSVWRDYKETSSTLWGVEQWDVRSGQSPVQQSTYTILLPQPGKQCEASKQIINENHQTTSTVQLHPASWRGAAITTKNQTKVMQDIRTDDEWMKRMQKKMHIKKGKKRKKKVKRPSPYQRNHPVLWEPSHTRKGTERNGDKGEERKRKTAAIKYQSVNSKQSSSSAHVHCVVPAHVMLGRKLSCSASAWLNRDFTLECDRMFWVERDL